MASRKHSPYRDYVGMIAYMVNSREIAFERRPEIQERFRVLVQSLNHKFRKHAASEFSISQGDEFQGLLWNGDAIPDLIWTVEEGLENIPLRIGFGYGPVTTRLPKKTIDSDGPALHTARAAIERAKLYNWMGGVFVGFGSKQDRVLNGLARLLRFQRQGFTFKQRQRVAVLREVDTQVVAAKILGLTPQTLNESVGRAGWEAYREGELALKAILSLSCKEFI